MESNETQGNPEIGMSADSFDAAETGSDEFFDRLDQEVNGGIIDTEVTQDQTSGPEQVTHNIDNGSNNVAQSNDGTDWEKRYKDSSREAVKWRDKFQNVEQFVPVLDAMKNDSGLVQHVREYLENGGKPAKSIQEELNLDEDFMYDQHEAMSNPDSDSAKVMNAHVDTLVQKRVGAMLETEKQRAMQIQQARLRADEETAFMKKNNMSQEEFTAFKDKAKNHRMTLDDINYLLNRDQANQNVANSTKQDMLSQMKNVRNMPVSASGANNQGAKESSPDRDVFDSILGFDNSVDNLFG